MDTLCISASVTGLLLVAENVSWILAKISRQMRGVPQLIESVMAAVIDIETEISSLRDLLSRQAHAQRRLADGQVTFV